MLEPTLLGTREWSSGGRAGAIRSLYFVFRARRAALNLPVVSSICVTNDSCLHAELRIS